MAIKTLQISKATPPAPQTSSLPRPDEGDAGSG